MNRSLAVALVSAGVSLGSTTIAPLARWIITNYDWRMAMLVVGDLVWVVIIPAAFLVREPPAPPPSPVAADGVAGPEMTVGQALRTPQFIAIALTYFACCATHSGPIFHMVTNAIDHGISAMAATTVLSVAGLASLGGKIVCGLIADRVGAKQTLVAGLALQAVAVSLYVFAGALPSFYALAVMFGFAYGGVMPLYAILVREYFGAKIMGSIFGAVASVSTLGMSLGPWIGGRLYDAYGSYFWLFIGSFAIGLGAVIIAFTFRPPRAIPAVLPSPVAAHWLVTWGPRGGQHVRPPGTQAAATRFRSSRHAARQRSSNHSWISLPDAGSGRSSWYSMPSGEIGRSHPMHILPVPLPTDTFVTVNFPDRSLSRTTAVLSRRIGSRS